MHRNEGSTSSEGRDHATERPTPPKELLDFLHEAEPRTLLLCGVPGAGKTTLALSLLYALDRSSFYISTRVGRGKLLHHFPWLVGALSPDRLVDLEDVRPASDRQEDLLRLLDQLTDSIDPLSAGRRIRDFLDVPETLARALGETPARAGHRFLFIDSWEGLVEPYIHLLGLDDLGRSSLEHGLLSLFHAAGFSLVLCAEGTAPQALSYLADGVVELRSEALDGGILRHFEVRKLRGVSIPRTSTAFTLHGGYFTCCPPLPHLLRPPHGVIPHTAAPTGPLEALSFGIPCLDQSVGVIAPGETILTELDGKVSSIPLIALLGPLYLRALQGGWKVTLLTDLALSPRVVSETLRHDFPEAAQSFELQHLPTSSRRGPKELWEDLRASLGPRTVLGVSVRSLMALTPLPGEDLVSRIAELQILAREQGAVLSLVIGARDPLLSLLATLVPLHLTLTDHHGTFIIGGRYPVVPRVAILVEGSSDRDRHYRYVPVA
ncbi:MAG: hypothetical protein KGJ23_04075 [Euryarchaeota archaeon]|nr:hypothetical protein [Euryarchaeota archaeon]MDE1835776.1 hypothetical protein [Euryarchaeota archaeon]MDE1881551.1 hypothetical protein [Euryarchaeota archaeon]MDE2043967.1 hypothetical protein [Thermoplasmata archaeon]